MLQKILFHFNKIKIPRSFVRNVSITSSWNVLIILSQFLLSPIITRLYDPAQYGIFALLSSIIVNINIIASLKYSDAIVICEAPRQRNNLFLLCLTSISLISLISFAIIFLTKDSILNFLDAPWLSNFLYVIPVIVFITGVVEVLLIINVSHRKFSNSGLAGFIMNIVSRGFTISYTLWMPARAIGLILGDLLGKLSALFCILFSFRNIKGKIKSIFSSASISGVRLVSDLYKQFPLYVLPATILTTLSSHLPIYFLQSQYSLAAVGAYALASSMLEMINKLIPYSVASVFLPKAIELKRKSIHELLVGVYKLHWIMLASGLFIFTGFSLLGEIVFPFVFGASWKIAGTFVAILSIHFAFNFISVSIAEVYKVIDHQKILLVTTSVAVGLRLAALILAVIFKVDVMIALLWFSCASAIGSIFQVLGVFIIYKFRIWSVATSLVIGFTFLVIITIVINF